MKHTTQTLVISLHSFTNNKYQVASAIYNPFWPRHWR